VLNTILPGDGEAEGSLLSSFLHAVADIITAAKIENNQIDGECFIVKSLKIIESAFSFMRIFRAEKRQANNYANNLATFFCWCPPSFHCIK
jgi:hypothetical protein